MYKYIRKTNFYFKEKNNQKKKKKTFFKSSECTTGHDRESLLLLLGMEMLFLRPKGFLFFICVSLPSWKEREIKTHLTHEWIGTLTVGPHNRIIKFKTFRKVENKSLFGGKFFRSIWMRPVLIANTRRTGRLELTRHSHGAHQQTFSLFSLFYTNI